MAGARLATELNTAFYDIRSQLTKATALIGGSLWKILFIDWTRPFVGFAKTPGADETMRLCLTERLRASGPVK